MKYNISIEPAINEDRKHVYNNNKNEDNDNEPQTREEVPII